jgi:hypothetical protein
MDRFALFVDGGYLADLRGAPLREKGVHTLLVHHLLVLARRVHLVVAAVADASWTLRQEADTVSILMPDRVRSFASAERRAGQP